MAEAKKLIKLNYQENCDASDINIYLNENFKIIDHGNKTFDKVADEFIGTESNCKFLLFCIFANCKQDGFDYPVENSEVMKFITIQEIFRKFSVVKFPVAFLINDQTSTNQTKPFYLGSSNSNVFISLNSYPASWFLQKLFILSKDSEPENFINKLFENNLKREHNDDDFKPNHDAKNVFLVSTNSSKFFEPKNETPNNGNTKYDIFNGKFAILSYDRKLDHLEKTQEIDIEDLKAAFEKIGLEQVFSEKYSNTNNLTKKHTNKYIGTISLDKEIDCLILCLIAHCENGNIFTLNETMPLMDIIGILESNISLIEKPKIIILLDQYKNVRHSDENIINFLSKSDEKKLVLFKDFMLIYSRLEGFPKQKKISNLFNEQMCSKYDFHTLFQGMFANSIYSKNTNDRNSEKNFFSNVYFKSMLQKLIFLKKLPIDPQLEKAKDLIKDKSPNYRMNNKGRCLILKFKSDHEDTEVTGSIKLLKTTFADNNQLNFHTKVIPDIKNYEDSVEKVKKELENLNSLDSKKDELCDCFFLFLFTNNNPRAKTSTEDIVNYFDKYLPMFGKPKFVFIQKKQDKSKHQTQTEIYVNNLYIPQHKKGPDSVCISKFADYLFYFNNDASIKQSIALLCDIFKHADKYDLVTLLTMVFRKYDPNLNMPYFNSTFTRLLYLKLPKDLQLCKEMTLIVKNGKCIVLNYLNFDKKELSTRDGTEKDVENLRKLFKDKLHFEFTREDDLNSLETKEYLLKLEKDETFSNYSCLVLCFLSHGGFNGVLHCKNGTITRDDLIKHICCGACRTRRKHPLSNIHPPCN